MRINWLILLLLFVCFRTDAFSQTGQDVHWKAIVEMNGNVFPSYILSTSNTPSNNRVVRRRQYIGDALGLFGIRIQNPSGNTKVSVTIKSDIFKEDAFIEASLKEPGVMYELFPQPQFNFDLLRSLVQPRPLNVTFLVSIAGGDQNKQTEVVRLRSINDCLVSWNHRGKKYQDTSWMFAAYVNEDHPWVDQLLGEALQSGVVNQFNGYQADPDQVLMQVYAIWNLLQRRGFRYSSITTTSNVSDEIQSQHVRFLEDSIKTSQANCVDGTVLMASLLRKIGIDPVIVLIPGHCFLGFFMDGQHQSICSLETTLMGTTRLSQYNKDNTLGGALGKILGQPTQNQASYNSFLQAVDAGNGLYKKSAPYFGKDPSYRMIDLATARKLGILPIK